MPLTLFLVIIELAVLVRLIRGWWRWHPAFTAAIAGGAAQHAASLFTDPAQYLAFWRWSTPALMVLQFCVAVELFLRWSKTWGRLGWRHLLPVFLGGIAFFVWWPGLSLPTVPIQLEAQRDLSYVLAVVTVLLWIVYAVPIGQRAPHGLRPHTLIVAAGWTLTACCFLLADWWPDARALANDLQSVGWALLLTLWCVRMPAPELAAEGTAPRVNATGAWWRRGELPFRHRLITVKGLRACPIRDCQ